MKDKLVLIHNQPALDYFPPGCSCCRLMELYGSSSFINRAARKLILSAGLPGKRAVLNDWIDEIKNCREIIIFDTGNAAGLIKWIKKEHPDKRVILYYWSPVAETAHEEEARKLGAELWSFDPADCRKYGLRYNSQFFITENMQPHLPADKEGSADVFFAGQDKNRAKTLVELKTLLDRHGISCFFNLVRCKGTDPDPRLQYFGPMKYSEVLANAASCRAVLDLVSEGQHGLTLRPMEALFYKKKLITNMQDISRFRIYDPDNVFVLGTDNTEDLPDFISSPYNDRYHAELCEYYMMDSWIRRFDMQEDASDFVNN